MGVISTIFGGRGEKNDDPWSRYRKDIASNYWNRDIPTWVDALPSMTDRREKSMLYHLVRDYPGEIRRIVDAGCFGGASTAAFCRALEDSERQKTSNMIVSYDLFETNQHSHNVFARFGIDAPVGGHYLTNFQKVIEGHEDIVSVVKGNILDFGWTG